MAEFLKIPFRKCETALIVSSSDFRREGPHGLTLSRRHFLSLAATLPGRFRLQRTDFNLR